MEIILAFCYFPYLIVSIGGNLWIAVSISRRMKDAGYLDGVQRAVLVPIAAFFLTVAAVYLFFYQVRLTGWAPPGICRW